MRSEWIALFCVLALLAALVCGALFGLVGEWVPYAPDSAVRDTRAIEQGDTIVEAIEKYEAAHGKPPPSLGVLVPGFLTELPVLHGSAWWYRAFEDYETRAFVYDLVSWAVRLRLEVNEEGQIREEWFFGFPDRCSRIPFDATKWKRGESRLEMVMFLHDQRPFVGRNISDVESVLGPPSEVLLLRRTPWELRNSVDGGFLGTSHDFLYWPGKNYSGFDDCDGYHRVGRWAVQSSES